MSDKSFKTLCIGPQESGITTLPTVTLLSMWTKANNLLSIKNSITSAPGNDLKAKMILSYSCELPHVVRSDSGGKYMCDALSGIPLKYVRIVWQLVY